MKKRKNKDLMYNYSVSEEIANSVSHGLGLALSIAELVILVIFASLYGSLLHLLSFITFGLCAIALYSSSTFYHAVRGRRLKKLFKLFDHIGIYLLIAGTYTPLVLAGIGGVSGWSVFAIIWLLAIAGIIVKTRGIFKYQRFSLILYVIMGWLCVFVCKELFAALSAAGAAMLVAGGLFYTLGIIFYVWDKLPHNHGIWHLFVLGGTTCHFFAILSLV